ncbi:MAG TPA: lipoprotein [Pseudomonadales bacterium]
MDFTAVRLLIVSLLLLLVTTCGQRGPLRLPDEAPPKQAWML